MNLLTSGSRSETLESETHPSHHQSIISQLKQTHSEDYHQNQLQQLPPLSSQRYYYSSTPSSSLYSSEPNSDSSLTLLLPLLVLLSSLLFVLLIFLIFLIYLRRRSNNQQPSVTNNQLHLHSHRSIRLRDQDGPIDLSPNHDDRFDSNTIRNLESNWLEDRSESARIGYHRAQMFEAQYPPNSQPTDITLTQFLSIQEKGVSAWAFEPDYYLNPSLPILVQSRTEIHFMNDGFGMSEAEGGGVCVQSNLPLPKMNEVYYFECKMYDKPESSEIAIGLATKPYPSFRLPGWNRLSIGYFSSDGFKSHNYPFTATSYGPPLREGDVLGVGYRPRTGSVFFTRNGRKLEDAYVGLNRFNVFPTIGATGPAVVHVNLGQAGFVFIEANVKKWGLAPSSGTLAPPPAYGHQLGSILLVSAPSNSLESQQNSSSNSNHQSLFNNQQSHQQRQLPLTSSSPSSPVNTIRPSSSQRRSRNQLLGYTNLNTDLTDQPLPHNPPTPRPLDISLEQMNNKSRSQEPQSHQLEEESLEEEFEASDHRQEEEEEEEDEVYDKRKGQSDENDENIEGIGGRRSRSGCSRVGGPSSRLMEVGSSNEETRPPRYAPVDPYKYAAGVAEVMLHDQLQGSSHHAQIFGTIDHNQSHSLNHNQNLSHHLRHHHHHQHQQSSLSNQQQENGDGGYQGF
ncbi:concanavalin A-like lectin/glucanase domain-containing protein [Phakopsora pachyrhizi]|uniref:Concanavalin A-like lectin/glucanase domain-containing protein n=1 Tax=Phakopsora pachyrhizi TaxID=170000 RepID=A0AAV0BA32_PHAPC|nr:concanavalin A-like lectin/glucanase domain-containing protein [Phakopsora pachyrhizi]